MFCKMLQPYICSVNTLSAYVLWLIPENQLKCFRHISQTVFAQSNAELESDVLNVALFTQQVRQVSKATGWGHRRRWWIASAAPRRSTQSILSWLLSLRLSFRLQTRWWSTSHFKHMTAMSIINNDERKPMGVHFPGSGMMQFLAC